MAGEAKRPLKVFLCHASDDKNQVRVLYKRLLAEGVDAWLDEEQLLPGQDWNDEILRALQESDAIIICLSRTSVSKEGYVQREIKEAIHKAQEKPSGTIFAIPSRLDDCEIPNYLKQWQWVDLFTESGFTKLMRSLKVRADRVGVTIEPPGYVSEENETERRLDQLYTEGLEAFYTENWDRAYQRFQMILRERPNHRDALAKLDEAELQRDLSILYKQASDSYQKENWLEAMQSLGELQKKRPDYKDSAQLLRKASQQKQLSDLYTEAKKLHAAEKWQAVVRVFDQIRAIDPDHPDTEALLPSSQKELAEIQRVAELNDLYTKGIREMDAGNWYEARSLLEKVHKAQTGYLETERLLKKVEAEITKIEERNKRNDQINLLYEQAHGLVRSKNWRKASEKIDEIRKLDGQFEDKDGLAEKINAALALEEQEAQKQNQLAAMYADAVRLMKDGKYQEALDQWQAVRAIDPKYPDRQWVQRTATRRFEELSQSGETKRSWSNSLKDWLRAEAEISADNVQFTEKLLLVSCVAIAIADIIYILFQDLLHISELGFVPRFLTDFLWGGMYGAVVVLVLSKRISNWGSKQSWIVILGWAIAQSIPLVLRQYIDVKFITIYALFAGVSTTIAIRSAKPFTRLYWMITTVAGWILVWNGGALLARYLTDIFNTQYVWAFADGFAILLGLLFTFGVQSKRSWEILRTAFFGALGFAIGRYVGYLTDTMLSLPAEITLPLWGLIGGAILEAPSRNTRQIAISAGVCCAGLLAGSLITEEVLPNFQYANTAYQDWNSIIWQMIWGAGIGLALGALIRRPSAIGVMVILGAGMFMVTRALNAGMPDLSDFWKVILRGALIGLVLGYGYEDLRIAGSPAGKLQLAKIWPVLLGIVGILLLTGWLLTLRSPADKVRIRVITSSDWTTVKLLKGAQLEDVKILSSSSQAINASFDGEIFGLNQLLEQAGSNVVSMTAEAVLTHVEPGVPLVFEIDHGGIGKTTVQLSNVVGQPALVQTLVYGNCCASSPPQYNVPSKLFEDSPYRWDFDIGIQGWGEFHDMDAPEATNGFFTFRSTGVDPSFESPTPLSISAAKAPVITVRMRIEDGSGTQGQIFFKTTQDPNWGENKSVVFALAEDGVFHTYSIRMSENLFWKGVVTDIRLDPIGDPDRTDIKVSIDYISVHAP